MVDFLYLRWKIMGLWTKLHAVTVLPAFLVYILLSALLARALKNKNDKIRALPFQIITVVILILEVFKQIYSFEDGVYNTYSLPFHYCSLFLYLLPLHSFYKGKYKKQADSAALVCLASLFFFMLVMPAIVYSDAAILEVSENFSSFHTVIFHNLVCFYFTLVVAMKAYEMDVKRDLKSSAIFLGIYVVIAAILSHTLEVNFHNLYKCNLAPVEAIRLQIVESIGWVGQLLYVSVMFVLTIAFAYLAYFLVKWVTEGVDKLLKNWKSKR